MSVYPRWRGEHNPVTYGSVCSGGLSPLARGTQKHGYAVAVPHRFIPAGAGNTNVTLYSAPEYSVYPRWRGEHGLPATIFFRCIGLSPLARGTLITRQFGASIGRFIPAGAGNTSPSHPAVM